MRLLFVALLVAPLALRAQDWSVRTDTDSVTGKQSPLLTLDSSFSLTFETESALRMVVACYEHEVVVGFNTTHVVQWDSRDHDTPRTSIKLRFDSKPMAEYQSYVAIHSAGSSLALVGYTPTMLAALGEAHTLRVEYRRRGASYRAYRFNLPDDTATRLVGILHSCAVAD